MSVKISNKIKIIYAVLILWLAPLIGHAAIYKWVDGNGTAHYSEKKPAKGKVIKLKLPPQPTSLKTEEELFQEREKVRRQEVDKENALKKVSTNQAGSRRPESVSGGREDGTDASRCALAKDVLNGSLKYSNGAPIDANDIKTASNDIRKLCH